MNPLWLFIIPAALILMALGAFLAVHFIFKDWRRCDDLHHATMSDNSRMQVRRVIAMSARTMVMAKLAMARFKRYPRWRGWVARRYGPNARYRIPYMPRLYWHMEGRAMFKSWAHAHCIRRIK